MTNVEKIWPPELKTAQEYVKQILVMLGSLRCHKHYHLQAQKEGILDDSEAMIAGQILMQIDSMIAIYKQQINNILERVPETEAQLVRSINDLLGNTLDWLQGDESNVKP